MKQPTGTVLKSMTSLAARSWWWSESADHSHRQACHGVRYQTLNSNVCGHRGHKNNYQSKCQTCLINIDRLGLIDLVFYCVLSHSAKHAPWHGLRMLWPSVPAQNPPVSVENVLGHCKTSTSDIRMLSRIIHLHDNFDLPLQSLVLW